MDFVKRIEIPLRKNNLNKGAISPYLESVYQQFKKNKSIIERDYAIYTLNHEILGKVRPHQDSDVNNTVFEPDIRAMVDWKVGYTVGNPIKYAQSKDMQTDDITELNKYIRNSNKRTVDAQVAKWAYATGVGYYFVNPKETEFNVKYEAPFNLFCVAPTTCGKVYSSYIGNEELFDFFVTETEEIGKSGSSEKRTFLSVYLPNSFLEYEIKPPEIQFLSEQSRVKYNMLPLVEKRFDDDYIGICSMAVGLQNAIDKLVSNSLDNIEDIVNEVWVFVNASLGKDEKEKANNFRIMKRAGAMEISSTNPNHQADVKTISTKLNLNDVLAFKENLKQAMYETVGVPRPSSNISSGNVTQGGGEIANGYDNAHNRALDDINTCIQADRYVLDRILTICKLTPDCNLDELYSSEIEIKYSFNMLNNMLTKSQSYVNFVANNVPPKLALRYASISNDPEAEGSLIESYIANKTVENNNNDNPA